eukprot:gene4308-6665_t
MQHTRQLSLSSLPLQASLYLSLVCALLWAISSYATLFYKGLVLPYPPGAWPGEFFLILFIIGLEFVGKQLASRGNLLEFRGPLLFAIVTYLVQMAGVVYMLRLQPYVVRLDLYMCSIFIGAKGIATLFICNQLMSLSI